MQDGIGSLRGVRLTYRGASFSVAGMPTSSDIPAAPPNALDDAYKDYRQHPGKPSLGRVVKELEPTINQVASSIDAGNDPLIKAQGRLLAAQAVQKYDPDRGAALPTFVYHQLQPLRRFKRQMSGPVRVADRTQIDAWHLSQAEKQFYDEKGREPDAAELADTTGWPLKKIEKVRLATRAIPTEGAIQDMFSGVDLDFSEEALDYVYSDADHVDRKILEHSTGYAGAPLLSRVELGRLIALSPGQVSKRAKRLALEIADIERALHD